VPATKSLDARLAPLVASVSVSARHYLFDDYAEEMKGSWVKLGSRIEAISNADNVVNYE